MTQIHNMPSAIRHEKEWPQGRVLKGQYVGAFRSRKGKLKGLLLRSGHQEYAIKLPKYLRPVLVSELLPESYVQVWAYPDEDIWRGINILPLPETERLAMQQTIQDLEKQPPAPEPEKSAVRIQVCCKGKCFKQGSREIWRQLEAEVADNPALQHVSVEATGCMKACKKGPFLRIGRNGRELHRVTPSIASAVLAEYS